MFFIAPTPAGVPVAMMSPGTSVIVRESQATTSATPKICFAVVPSWTTLPLMRVRSPSPCRSAISSMSTSAGPQGAKVSIALPLAQSEFWSWRSRALTSLNGIAPAMQERASPSLTLRAVRPITIASSAS